MLVGLTLRPSPGIGKTRLAAACADRLAADGFRAAWVSCPEDAGAPPFWVWEQLLGQLGMSGALRGQAEREADPGEASANHPLLLVVDDLHWADQGSRRLLATIRGALATMPVVILCTYRDTEPCQPSCYQERCGRCWSGG